MIQATSLSKDYGRLRAVDDVSFEVKAGEILGFLGPNGAGKSTTMKMITGFLPPTSGTASIGGHDIREAPIEAKKLLGYLPESGPLYAEMTVLEFLLFAAKVRRLDGAATAKALDQVVEICHLEGVRNQPIETLSKGFRQRVGMAQAILHEPSALIMDEPTDGLDPNQKQEVRRLIAGMAEDKAIILSTHILEEVTAMCTRVIIIAKGKVIADDTPAALLARHPLHGGLDVTVAASESLPVADVATKLEALAEVASAEVEGQTIRLLPTEGADLNAVVLAASRDQNWPLERISPVATNLDAVFRNLTQGNLS